MEALLLLAAMHSCNECIIREGERRETRLPPFRMIIIATLRIPRILGEERVPLHAPTQCAADPFWPPHSPPADPQSEDPNEESRGATVLSRKCCWTSV